jgi:HPt (histidine-containing phosphotransfer) domain-containing protein
MDPVAVQRLEEIGGRALVATLVTLVLEELPPRLARVHAAIQAEDRAALGPAAHSLISSTGNFGAFGLADLARRIEIASPDAPWGTLAENAAELDTLAREFLAELEQVRHRNEEPTDA